MILLQFNIIYTLQILFVVSIMEILSNAVQLHFFLQFPI